MRSLIAGTVLLTLGTTALGPSLALAQTSSPTTAAPGTQAVPPEKPATASPDAPKPDVVKPDPAKPDASAAPMKPVEAVPGQPATFTDNLRPTFVAQSPDDMVSSKLVGQTIINGANETIGEIADVVIGFDGKVKAWVVGVGGFLGIGTKYVAVDPSAMHLQRVDGKALRAMINTDKDQLRAAPEYIYLGKEKPKDDAGKADAAK
ncbi:PRC-barrel domain-containing protein [Methylobacterium sp. E-025]|uniref:PRC-barrel domain-containing protein n=1 Tax=Methylobacterium sp. E-025 TaxID=2836561 RepID=UPI0028BD315D|nr:PRC-barrel domain-containing protein [Methylobacterium sp. E-025]